MADSDHLHALIHSMSKSEKRYFRLYVVGLSGKHQNQSLELFDTVRGMDTYQFDVLKKRLKGNKLLDYLPRARNNLYHTILKSMRAYQAQKSPLRQLRGMIMDGIYLYEKTLYQQSWRTMQKARKIAEGIGDLNGMLEILTWERKLIKLTGGASKADQVKQLMVDEDQLLKQKNAYHAYYGLLDRAFMLVNHSLHARDGSNEGDLQELLEDPLLREGPIHQEFHCVWFYHQTMAIIAVVKGDYAEAKQSYLLAMDWWEKHPKMIEADVLAYRNLMANLIQIGTTLELWEETKIWIEGIRNLPVRSELDGILLEQHLFQIELHSEMNQGRLDQAEKLAEKIIPWFKTHASSLPPGRVSSLSYNLMVLFFILGDYRKALNWANRILDESENNIRQDLKNGARILQLIFYFELGFEEWVQYRFRSVYRQLYRQGHLHSFELLVMKYLKKLASFSPRQIPQHLVKEALGAFQDHADEQPEGRSAPGEQEVIYWLESQSRNLPVRDIVEARLG